VRNTYFSAIIIFTLASLGCGFSESLNELLFYRVLQGVGGALLPDATSGTGSIFGVENSGGNLGGYLFVKGKIWVNNGEINTVVFEDQIPEGFTKGVLEGSRSFKKPRNKLTCPHCNYTGKGEGNMYRWHFDNCKNNPNNTTIKVKKIAYHDIETGKRVYLPEGTPPTDNLVRGY
jgi:hypothetical protein